MDHVSKPCAGLTGQVEIGTHHVRRQLTSTIASGIRNPGKLPEKNLEFGALQFVTLIEYARAA